MSRLYDISVTVRKSLFSFYAVENISSAYSLMLQFNFKANALFNFIEGLILNTFFNRYRKSLLGNEQEMCPVSSSTETF